MKSFAFFALLLLAATAKAQTPADQIAKLQKDPNVIWIGEIYRDYENLDNNIDGLNQYHHKPETLPDGNVLHSHRQNTTTLKRQAPDDNFQGWDFYIWQQIIDPNVSVFADANLTKRLSAEAKTNCLSTIDTVEIFDPNDFTVELSTIVKDLAPENIYAYRLRQLVYYNSKENMYYNLPLSIAPIALQLDYEDKKTGLKPVFWLPITASSTPIKASQAPNMTVIKSVVMDMALTGAKVLKKSKTFDAVNKMWFDYMRSQQNYILATHPEDNPNKNVLSPQDFSAKINPVDTIATFDPETFAEIITVEKSEIDFKILDLRINQTFGWDSSKKMFTIATHSVAPLRTIKDNDGSILTSYPLFYLYPHRRFKTVPK